MKKRFARKIQLKSKGLLMAYDMACMILSYFIIIFLLHEKTFLGYETKYIYSVVLAGGIYLSTLLAMGMYKTIWAFGGLREYARCIAGCFVAFVLVSMFSAVFGNLFLSYKYHMLAGAFVMITAMAARVVIRVAFERYRHIKNGNQRSPVNMLIVGAGVAASAVMTDITKRDFPYNVVGLIDDDEYKKGCTINSVKIIGGRERIIQSCAEYEVDEILIAIPSLKAADKQAILNICHNTPCKVRVLPNISDITDMEHMLGNARDVQIEDLLAREQVSLDNKLIASQIAGKVVLITGGGGSIGSELCIQIAKYNPQRLVVLDIYENNAYDIENELRRRYPDLNLSVVIASVRDKGRIANVFETYLPQLVFHAAAHKHVPLMESSPSEAVHNNVMGTLNVAECAYEYGAEKFVFISSDKAVNPTNVMGATKRLCEMIVQSLGTKGGTKFAAVRFGNVLGSNGSVIPLFKKQIQQGEAVTVTHKEVTRFFMTIPEAAQLVLQAASYAKGGEIFVLDMGEPVKIYDLAVKMIKLSGLEYGRDIDIDIVGLRPGEKLYEEVLMDEEELRKTQNEKIFIAKPMKFEFNKIKSEILRLVDIADTYDGQTIKIYIKKLVPTYAISDVHMPEESSTNKVVELIAKEAVV